MTPDKKMTDAAMPVDEFATEIREVDHSTVNRTGGAASHPDHAPVLATESRLPGISRFEIRKILGEGAFGAVYLADDTVLGRSVALKVPKSIRFTLQETIAEFIAEARTVSQINHPRIVRIHDVTQQADGLPVVVMEYIDGPSLKSLLENEKLSPRRCAELMADIAEAVAEAHRQGLVHRDLKPANILVDRSGVPHVADFGLAVHESIQRQRKGEYAGTVPYMAPEQVRGEVHRLDGRADIWALGVMLYQLLTGRLPFGGNSIEQLTDEILHRDPKPPRQIDPSLPVELERIIAKCCAKEVGHRYSTASDLASDLRAWLTASFNFVSTTDRPLQAPPPMAGRRFLPWAVGAVVCGILGVYVWQICTGRDLKIRKEISLTPSGAGDPSTTETVALRVQAIDVKHFVRSTAGDVDRGLLGRGSFSAALGDSVQVTARLSQPAYAYLIAFRPDGTTDLCFPESEDVAPSLTDMPRYPADNKLEAYELAEGAGLWVFAVIASEEPLPPYREVKAKLLQHVDWKPLDHPPQDTVWWCDGTGKVEDLTNDTTWTNANLRDGSNSRGKGKQLKGPQKGLHHLAVSLESLPHVQVSAALAFGVTSAP